MDIITIGTVVPHFGEEGQYFFTCKKDSSVLLGGNFFKKLLYCHMRVQLCVKEYAWNLSSR